MAAVPVTLSAQSTSQPAPFLLGADISTLTQAEQRGDIFQDKGKPGDSLAIFTRHGWNCFRLRIFVNPDGRGGVINSLEYTRALAKRIKASGAVLILDFHYSDTWADPQHQEKPAAWSNLDFDALTGQVEKYTSNVMADLKRNGALPDIVQVGNEITGGTLWPIAQVEVPHSTVKVYDSTVRIIEPPQPYDETLQWDRLTRILKAGARGVREATEASDDVRIMIHIDCGGDWPVTQWFFDHLQQHSVNYDLIGQSYYPYWHGTMENVLENLAHTAARFGKPIMIVETSYPWTDSANWSRRRNMAWPISPDGQRQFLTELVQTVRETPNQLGVGVIYWFPESVALRGNGQRIWNGGDMALFDHDGNALPAMDLPESLAARRGDAADESALSKHK